MRFQSATIKGSNSLGFDLVTGGPNAESLCRNIAKQIVFPFDEVVVDSDSSGMWSIMSMKDMPGFWKGTLDDFIKFGTRGRRKTSFESRLNKALSLL